jgi:hypothetical protein
MDEHLNRTPEQISQLGERLDLLKKEVDALQIAVTGQRKVWYKDASTIVAALALAFSFGTTFVSLRRAEVQDVQSTRQELRGLLQRLTALPKENIEAQIRYKGDPNALGASYSLVSEETALLTRQAAELAKKLPRNSVSATEYYAIANSMQNSYNLAGEKEFLKLSMDAAKDFNDEIATLRASANLEFIEAHPEAGRVVYQQALNIFAKYPGYDQYTVASTNILTEQLWANSEAGLGSRALVGQHIVNAENILGTLGPGPYTDFLRSQIEGARQRFEAGGMMAARVAEPPSIPSSGAKP